MTDEFEPSSRIINQAAQAATEVQRALNRSPFFSDMPADQAEPLIAAAEARVVERVVAGSQAKKYLFN